MTFRESFRPVYQVIQQIAGPTGLDVRTNRIFAVVRTHDGGAVRTGSYTDERTEILPRPRVQERDGGRTLVCTPVNIMMTPAELNPSESSLTEVFYQVEGPNEGDYTGEAIDTSRPFRRTLVLRALNRRQPNPEG